MMNYNPNMTCSGRMAKQVVRLTFGQWEFRKTIDVTVGGNCTGLGVIDSAVGIAFDKLDSDGYSGVFIVMGRADGETLRVQDDEERGDDWLKDMIISAEIVSIEESK